MIQCIHTQAKIMTDDDSCPNCYYEKLDMDEYPCSRCVRNAPTEDKFRAKVGGDLISRDDAINRVLGTGYAEQIKDNMVFILRNLPSAHCTDCPLKGVVE